jgi:integrase
MTRREAQAQNHPAKGSIITQQPITDKAKLQWLKDNLSDHPRNHALFVCGINMALRASDLLTLKVGQVKGDKLVLREKKRGKVREFYLNGAIKRAVTPLTEGRNDNDFLFPSETTGYAMTVEYFSGMVKAWCFRAGLKGNYASHSLRKTWARAQVDAGEPIWKVSEALGHSSEKTSRLYLGLGVETLREMHMREV